jgi:hypothetical protein
MATQNPSVPTVAVTFPTTGEGLYVFASEARELDITGQLIARLDQLSAMLVFTYGEQLEDFDRMSDEVRSSFMWGCASAVDECQNLAQQLEVIASRRRMAQMAEASHG